MATVSAPLHASSAKALPVLPPAIANVTSKEDTVDAFRCPMKAPAIEPSGTEKFAAGNVGAKSAHENGEPLHTPAAGHERIIRS